MQSVRSIERTWNNARRASVRPIARIVAVVARVFNPCLRGAGRAWVVNPCYNERMTRILIAFVICVSTVGADVTHAATLEKPVYAEVFLKTGSDKVAGNVTAWDTGGITVRAGTEDRPLKWGDLTPTSAFILRNR